MTKQIDQRVRGSVQADRWTRGVLGLLCALLLLVSVGCEPEDDPREPVSNACGEMGNIVNRFGPVIRGPYSSATLADFVWLSVPTTREQKVFGGEAQRLAAVPPTPLPCDADIAQRLELACNVCSFNGANDGRFATPENCLLEVESVFWTPSAACALCGDGRCTGEETSADCPDDCKCGDGYCDLALGELPDTCPADCPVSCGNGVCEYIGGEACTCDPNAEGCTACARDCCDAVCGDLLCEPAGGEDADNCEQDCAAGFCGDGLCIGREDTQTCPEDCVISNCLVSTQYGQNTLSPYYFGAHALVCGDGICTGCEPWTCNIDCADLDMGFCSRDENGVETCPAAYCGDGACNGAEDAMICPLDCAIEAESSCNNSVCERSDMLRVLGIAPEDVDRVAQSCPDIGVCDQQLCGDGYCQAWELSAQFGVPFESNSQRVCPEDCGNSPCPDYDREVLCPNGSQGRYCGYAATYPGDNVFGSVVVDCSLPCPLAKFCTSRCIDLDGDVACGNCPGVLGHEEPCAPGDPDRCIEGFQWSCVRDSFDPESRAECYSYRRIEQACP